MSFLNLEGSINQEEQRREGKSVQAVRTEKNLMLPTHTKIWAASLSGPYYILFLLTIKRMFSTINQRVSWTCHFISYWMQHPNTASNRLLKWRTSWVWTLLSPAGGQQQYQRDKQNGVHMVCGWSSMGVSRPFAPGVGRGPRFLNVSLSWDS